MAHLLICNPHRYRAEGRLCECQLDSGGEIGIQTQTDKAELSSCGIGRHLKTPDSMNIRCKQGGNDTSISPVITDLVDQRLPNDTLR